MVVMEVVAMVNEVVLLMMMTDPFDKSATHCHIWCWNLSGHVLWRIGGGGGGGGVVVVQN